MESLTYSNFFEFSTLSQTEQVYLEKRLISSLSLLNKLNHIKPTFFLFLITFVLIFNIALADAALKEGDRGSQVFSLQQKLHSLGYFQGKVTGYFGTQTQQAVKQFQKAKNLPPDGIVGKHTLSALSNSSQSRFSQVPTRTIVTPSAQGLKKGDRGNAVFALQQQLQQLGYFQGKITGYFGSQTEQAVKQFQAAKNLPVDGIVGKNTLLVLSNPSQPRFSSSPSRPSVSSSTQGLKKGDRGNAVFALQQQLQKLGYFQGKITGYFGSQTEQAVKQFQSAKNLPVDGIVGSNTLHTLNNINNVPSSKYYPSVNISAEQIKSVQANLKNLGYFSGNIDGNYGVNTRNSLLKFQRDHSINNHPILVENFRGYSSSFGYRISSISRLQESHNGLDFAAPQGSYIKNWRTGIVTELSDHTACGTLVRIQSGNFEHAYCHLEGSIKIKNNVPYLYDPQSGLNIKKGQTIPVGAKIGRVGMTGRTTGPHLHWGLKYKGNFIDPFLVLLN